MSDTIVSLLKQIRDESDYRLKNIRAAPTIYFGWQEEAAGNGIVICIGSNYGQNDERASEDMRAALGPWRRNYCFATKCVVERESEWRATKWLVGSRPPLNPRYFIMTNVVPWTSQVAWTSLATTETEELVAEAKAITPGGYLSRLAQSLPDAFAVGHGISLKTLPHVRLAARLWRNHLLYANLSFPQTPGIWDTKLGRFKFGRRRR